MDAIFWRGGTIVLLYTVSEVAKMLKVNRNFVYNEIKKGNLEAVKIGSIKIRKDKLEEYINGKERDCWLLKLFSQVE